MKEQKRALGAVVVVLCLLLMVAVLFPLLQPRQEYGCRQAPCQTRIKELGMALKMYMDENGNTLPSSAVCGSSDKVFRMTQGQWPPPEHGCKTVFQLLYPYMKNKSILYCDKDPAAVQTTGIWPFRTTSLRTDMPPSSCPNYVLKKAIDLACLDPKVKARKEDDFNWPAEQIIFYERGSFHWGNTSGDLSDPNNPKKLGATANVFFMDGHVKAMRLTIFEPDYYNTDPNTGSLTKKPQINPRLYCDTLN